MRKARRLKWPANSDDDFLHVPQHGVKGASAGKAGVESGLLDVHRCLYYMIDDVSANALFDQQAKLPTLEQMAAEATTC